MLILALLWQFSSWFSLRPDAVAAARTSSASQPEQVVLTNGLKVVVLEDHSFPVVSSMVWYRVGARNETMGTTGLSHLVEHLLFRNVGSFRKGEMSATIARAGGQFNGYTSDDFTTFFEILPGSKLELAMKVESERMCGATFADADVQGEITNIQNEFEAEAKDPVDGLSREVRAAAYQQHPYHNPTMGWRNDVENLTASQCRSFYERYFRPDNAILVIVGDVKREAALGLVKKYFSSIARPQSPVAAVTAVEPAQKGERRVTVKYSGKQEVLQVAYHAPALHDPDAPVLAVLEKLLNAAYSGRLKTALLDQKICSSASSRFEAKEDPGLFTITCAAAPGNGQQQVLPALDQALSQLREKPVPEADLKRARNQAEFAFFSERDGPYRAAFHLGFYDTLVGWQSAYTWPEHLRTVSVADLQRVARRYFNPDNRVIGWLSSPNAPKVPAQKPSPGSEQAPAREPQKNPHSKQVEHVRMTGYKRDDKALAPGSSLAETLAAPNREPGAAPAEKPATGEADAGSQEKQPNGKTAETARAVAGAMAPGASTGKLIYTDTTRRVYQRVLKNGMTLVVFESHLSPVLEIRGAIKAGDAFDPAGKRGISAVTAMTLNAGSDKRSRAQIQSLQEDSGLPPNAMLKFEGGLETIGFQTKCLSRDLSNQLSIIADVLSSPLLADADVERAKQEAISAVKRQEDTLPARVDRALLRSLLASGSPYLPGDPGERMKSIGNLKPADVQNFQKQYLVPGSTFLVIAGDVTNEQALQLTEKAFASWSGRGQRHFPPVQASGKRVVRTSVPTKDKSQSIVSLGQLIPVSRNHQEYAQLLLADCALTNHPMLSRLGQRLGAEPTLASAVSVEDTESKLEPLANAMTWSLTLNLEPDTISRVSQALQSEVKKFAKAGLTSEELAESKRYLLGAIPVRTQSNLSLAAQDNLEAALLGGEPPYLSRVLSNVRGASLESVNKLIRTTFKPDQATLVVAGTGQSLKAVRAPSTAPAQQPATTDATTNQVKTAN